MNVELVAYTPNPEGVCNLAAQTCVASDIPVIETSVNGKKALRHALASGHESVLEHANFTFTIEGISRACSHQLVRHRMASFSQQSQRYVKMDGFECVIPATVNDCEEAIEEYKQLMNCISSFYHDMVHRYHIPEEDARYILPNACCTNLTLTMNARELRHFFGLRCCTRAQWEIRELANTMLELCQEVAPLMFDDAGPQCVRLGYCPESRGSCGRYPQKS